MISENQKNKTLTIGFLDYNIESNLKIYNKNFDIVLADNENFNTVKEILSFDCKDVVGKEYLLK